MTKTTTVMRALPTRILAMGAAVLLAACGGSDPQADVSIVGTGPGQPVAPGTVAEFRMRVSNAGPDAAEDVLVTNTLDGRLTLVDIGCEAEGGAQCPSPTAAGMTIGRLGAGAALTFVVRGQVPASVTGGLVLNQMSTRRIPGDPNLSNNSSTTSAVVANAQLTTSYTAPETLAAGNDLVFTAAVTNLGPASATDVQLSITDPVGVTPLPVTCESFDGALCPLDMASRPLVAPLMPAGSRLRLRVPYATAPALRGDLAGSFAAATPSDPNPDNNVAQAGTRAVAPTARLAVAHSVTPVSSAGTSAAFRATLDNRGATSFALVMTQSLPPGLQATGWRCTASAGAACPAQLGPSMTLDMLPAGATLVFDYAVALPLSLAGSDVVARFAVSAEGVPEGADSVDDAITAVRQPQADLQVRQSVPTQVAAGAPLQFAVTVTNLGPDIARGARLDHALSGDTVTGSLRYSCSAAGGAACPTMPAATQMLADMPVGSSIRLFVEATAGAAGGSISGQAAVTTAGDPQPANDTDLDTVAVVPPPTRLSASLSAAATSAIGSEAAFTARITNGGPADATGLRIDFAAAGLAGAPQVTCTASVGASCPAELGALTAAERLPAGSWLQLRYALPVPAGATPGTLIVGEVAASADGDPASGDNLATASTTLVAAPADLQLAASLAASLPQGEPKTVVVVLSNRGPSTARAATLRYTPSETAVPLTLRCTAAGGASCPTDMADPTLLALESLPVGGSLRLSYGQATDAMAVGTTIEDAVLVSYAGDPDPSNDEAVVSSLITAPADVRNGDYRLYGGDGRQRTLRLDFDAGVLSVDGVAHAFTGPDADGSYDAGAGRRFRIADDLVVGLDDSDGRLMPYVAARRFVTDLEALGDGTDLVLLGRSEEAGVPASRYAGARWRRDLLEICGEPTPKQVGACAVGAVSAYRLSMRGDLIDATDASGSGQAFSFRVARAGSELILLRTGASAALWQAGLVAVAPASRAHVGGTTVGDWGTGTLALAPPQVTFDGPGADMVDLGADTTGWPQGLLGGVRASDGAAAFAFGSPHLLVMVTARTTPAAGFVFIGLAR